MDLPPPALDDRPDIDPTPVARPGAGDPTPVAQPGAGDDVAALGARLVATIDAVVAGQHEIAEVAVATLLAGGNLLIEDIPGVGKTLLAQVIARAVGGSFGRIQGTPDLLPGDVTGSMLPVPDGRGGTELRFRPGPIFANVVVFDEMNRATPRTQSALLEAAEEATVTVDGDTHRLPHPFMLVATQNPIEVAGTYGIGEGSLDRFAAVVTPGRAARQSELDVLTGRRGRTMLGAIEPVTAPDHVAALRRQVATVQVADTIGSYVVDLLEATRQHPDVRLGASTRAGVSLIALGRARAALHGRSYVVADDVAQLAVTALGHRVTTHDGDGSTVGGRQVVAQCVSSVVPPSG